MILLRIRDSRPVVNGRDYPEGPDLGRRLEVAEAVALNQCSVAFGTGSYNSLPLEFLINISSLDATVLLLRYASIRGDRVPIGWAIQPRLEVARE